MIALLGVWLWLDYRSDPSHSLLALLSLSLAGWLPAGWRSWLGQEAQVLGLPLSADTKAYWYMARAGGLLGYLLLWLSVVWGLVLSTKITDRLISPVLAYGLHEFLSIGTILFSTLHALILLGDRYIGFNIFHLAVPFLAPYEPLWTGLGTLGLYLSAALTGSFYLRKQMGQKAWRALHYLTFVAYSLALGHGIMAGSDSGLGLVQGMYLVTGGSVLFLVYYRLFTLKVKTR
ncbi:MAG: hypothetical protein HC875_32010 [Anaerolineales bacterium]|nr:hypothetical protein [Anaerolineales bacterium]